MSAVRIITTDSSVWTIDFANSEFRRDPRESDTEHPFVRYDGEWRTFDCVEERPHWSRSDRIRFTVFGPDVDGKGSTWITSTYKPAEQDAAK